MSLHYCWEGGAVDLALIGCAVGRRGHCPIRLDVRIISSQWATALQNMWTEMQQPCQLLQCLSCHCSLIFFVFSSLLSFSSFINWPPGGIEWVVCEVNTSCGLRLCEWRSTAEMTEDKNCPVTIPAYYKPPTFYSGPLIMEMQHRILW